LSPSTLARENGPESDRQPDELAREEYLRKQMREIHADIEACKSGELPHHLLAQLRLRAGKTRDALDAHLEKLAALAEPDVADMDPDQLVADLASTLRGLPGDLLARVMAEVRQLREVG
jgi:hypothetical protein